MDSLDWSKRYEVLSFSRLTLSSRGFTNEQIASLTDEDMQRIADMLHENYSIEAFDVDVVNSFDVEVQHFTKCMLEEKEH